MMDNPRSLRDLFAEIQPLSPKVIPETPITAVTSDSRAVQPGALFVAVSGGSLDGHHFIPDALTRGAAAVVGTQPGLSLPVPYVQVSDGRSALARLAAAFYGYPARRLTVLGVTGTDGKTTTTNLIHQIMLAAGLRAGMISTINAVIGDEILDTGFHVTTPDATDVQSYLACMLAAGLTHVVLEATSHGLAQHRVDACEFDIGVVTNITHEHLDYHGSYEAYRDAKARLLQELALTGPKPQGNPRLAVINRDDQSYDFLHKLVTVRQVAYSLSPGADLWAEEVVYGPHGVRFTAVAPGFKVELSSSLVGAYNVHNILAAVAATALGLGLPAEAVQRGVAALSAVPGRMERIDLGQDFTAIVDFAHTPNALQRALETARQLTSGRVLVVFGSAGLRDRQKRRLMAEVSARLADISVLTAEDPRTESLDAILAEMAAGASSQGGLEGQTFFRVPDRGEAIRLAVRLARPGDLVIACGKGHEQSMCFGETEYLWDDRTAMRAALSERLGIPGPAMPYLPTRDFPSN